MREDKKFQIKRDIDAQKKRILDGALVSGDAIIEKIQATAGSDIAAMRSQMDDNHDEAVHKHNATPGIKHILLLNPTINNEIAELRNRSLQKTLAKTKPTPTHNINLNIFVELAIEFTSNPHILKGAYPELFLLKLNEKCLKGCDGLKTDTVERLLTFYDPRFAESIPFLFYTFSQKMRHAAAQQSALHFK